MNTTLFVLQGLDPHCFIPSLHSKSRYDGYAYTPHIDREMTQMEYEATARKKHNWYNLTIPCSLEDARKHLTLQRRGGKHYKTWSEFKISIA